MTRSAEQNTPLDVADAFGHGARMLDAIFELTATQHGLVTRAQLRNLGFERHRVARWVESGRLVRIHANVFSIGGVARTPESALLATVLETGHDASASHTTAAALWGIAGYHRLEPHHVVVCRISRHHQRLTWTVHQFTGVVAEYQRMVKDIPVTSPALTLLHLASMVSPGRLERAIDSAWSLGIVTGKDLAEIERRLAQRGRNGIVALRTAMAERDEQWVPPQSNLESRFMELIRTVTGLEFQRQVQVRTERWSARVDFLHAPSRTIVEVQSERYHSSLTEVSNDARRRERLERQGFTVVEVWDSDLFHRPDQVVERVVSAVHRPN